MKQLCSLAVIVGAVISLVLPSLCQQEESSSPVSRLTGQNGLPIDWTHSHVLFSRPAAGDADATRQEPRYWLQQLRRLNMEGWNVTAATGDIGSYALRHLSKFAANKNSRRGQETDTSNASGSSRRVALLKRDWSQAFQTGGTAYAFASPTYPAKFSFSSGDPNPDCNTDYVAFTLPTGSIIFPGNFNIIAFNNLYVSAAGGSSFCSGTAPNAMFAYNASSAGGPLNGSPALSLDGTLIAFIENATPLAGGAVFHVLKWHSGDIQTIDLLFPRAFNVLALANCATNGGAAPCEYSLQYTPSGSRKAATLSSPFIDYITDTAYVSDDAGNVYAIAPVFTATPATPPVILSGWPINVGSSLVLTPPVYDGRSKNVFVASATGAEFFVKTAGSTTGSCSSGSTPCLGSNSLTFTGGGLIQDGPVVDSSTGRVWVFGTQTGGTSGSYIVQADTQLSAGSVSKAQIGTGTLNAIHPGTPDDNYFTSVATGKFYVCGQNATGAGQLYAFGFNAGGVMNTSPVTGSPFLLANATAVNAPCSGALTEIFNQSVSTDWLFGGVKARCVNTVGATTGCVLSFDITSAFPAGVAMQMAVSGGASGIVVDGVTDESSTEITTDIYFMSLGAQSCLDYNGTAHTGTCGISATQSGLD